MKKVTRFLKKFPTNFPITTFFVSLYLIFIIACFFCFLEVAGFPDFSLLPAMAALGGTLLAFFLLIIALFFDGLLQAWRD